VINLKKFIEGHFVFELDTCFCTIGGMDHAVAEGSEYHSEEDTGDGAEEDEEGRGMFCNEEGLNPSEVFFFIWGAFAGGMPDFLMQ